MKQNIFDLQVKDKDLVASVEANASPSKTVKQNGLIALALIFSITLMGIVSLTRNTDMEIDINFGENKSVNIKGKQPLPPPTKTNDCLSSGKSSHSLNCNNH